MKSPLCSLPAPKPTPLPMQLCSLAPPIAFTACRPLSPSSRVKAHFNGQVEQLRLLHRVLDLRAAQQVDGLLLHAERHRVVVEVEVVILGVAAVAVLYRGWVLRAVAVERGVRLRVLGTARRPGCSRRPRPRSRRCRRDCGAQWRAVASAPSPSCPPACRSLRAGRRG